MTMLRIFSDRTQRKHVYRNFPPERLLHSAQSGCPCGYGFYGFFFFQAEDGIRDWSVTGVQTCALPILATQGFAPSNANPWVARGVAPKINARMIRLDIRITLFLVRPARMGHGAIHRRPQDRKSVV